MDQYKVVIDQIDAHAQLLMTFALAIVGGIVAATLQVMFHNRDKEKVIHLRFSWMLLVAYVISILSLAAGYFLKSALVASVASISQLDFNVDHSVTAILAGADLGLLSQLSVAQFALLAASLILLVIVLMANFGALSKPQGGKIR